MDATQRISDSILESDVDESEGESENRKGRPLAKLCVLKNEHIPETELPLFLGDNVLGRDPSTCSLPLSAPSISKQHATISISVYARRGYHSEMDIEALVWDVGSMNGTRKGRLRLTPNVRYALSDGDSLVVADIPCQYISCAVKQKDLGTPVSKYSRVKNRLPEASGGKGSDKISGSNKCVNKEAKARASLTKTPATASCLSFEQTPTQPQGTLVPDSDSESEDERWGKRTRGLKTMVSDSDSHKSSPTCSTFLSPVNKTVPESEDESPVTPLSSTKDALPYKDVSLGNDESGVVMGLKQNDVEDRKGEKETVTPDAIKPDKNDQHVAAISETNVHLAVNDDLLVHSPEVSTNPITAFNMDSDTDMEGEEQGLDSAGRVMLNQADRPPNTDQFHLDSDTDVDEDVDDFNKAPKTVSENLIKSFHVKSHIQPKGIAVDSDTDVDEDPAVSDADKKSKSMPLKETCIADSTSSVQQNDFCLHSDSDVDEEAETKCRKNESSSKIDTRLDINSVSPNSTNSTPHCLHLDSDTDDEAKPIPALSEAPVVPSTKVCPTADTGANLAILPDSDTDVEADSPLVVPVAVTTLSVSSTNLSEALQSVSDADTDVDEPMVSCTGNVHNSSDHRVNCGTDVEYKEVDEGQSPKLCKEQTPGFLTPAVQNCSTPVQVSGVAAPAVAFNSSSDSQDEEDFVVAETQSFVLQTRHCQGNSSDNHILDPTHAGIEHSDEEKDGPSSNRRSFHLGLSDSSHIQCQTHALATESTQAFVPLDKHLNLEETQAYSSISTTGRAAGKNADNMEATQTYGMEEEKEAHVDFALEATQAYISELHSDSENDTDQTSSEETQPLNCPTSSTLAMAETQPMSDYVEEEGLAANSSPLENVKSKILKKMEVKDKHVEVAQPQGQFLGEALSVAEIQPIRTCNDEYTGTVANSKFYDIDTQPVGTAEGSSQEDSIPFVRKKRTKPLQLEETQSSNSPGMLTVEPQPVVEDNESDDEDLIQGPKKRKGKPLEEECMQTLSNSELSTVETKAVNMDVAETQPMATSGNEQSDVESDEENSPTLVNTKLPTVKIQQRNTIEKVESDEEGPLLCSRKRRTKPLQLEETQPLSSPEMLIVEPQPVVALEDKESDDEELIPGPRKRKAKPLQLEEEWTQTLTNSELSVADTQSMATSGNGENNVESEEEKSPTLISTELSAVGIQQRDAMEKVAINEKDENFNSRKRRTKQQQLEQTQPLSSSGGSIVDTQPMGSCKDEESIREDLISSPAKPFQLDDKQTQSLTTTEVCAVDPQLRVIAEDKESSNKESFPCPEKMQAKVLQLKLEDPQMPTDFKCSTAEIQYLETKSEQPKTAEHSEPGTSGVAIRNLSETGQQLKEEDQQAKCSDPSKRQTKGKAVKKQYERKKREEKKILGNEKRDLEESLQGEKIEQVNQLGLEREETELEKEKKAQEKQTEELQENIKDVNMLKVPTRGRRAARRTVTQLEPDSTASTNDDVPAKRTRSRSNSSNSVSSERSVSSINTQESRGRGRSREVKRTSDTPLAGTARRRRTVAAETTQQISNNISPRGCRSRSNSSNSLNSEISSCSEYTQIKGRGGRQRGRGRKTEPNLIPPVSSQGVQNLSPKPTARGRKSCAAAGSTNIEKVNSPQAATTRGQQRASADSSKPEGPDEQGQSNQDGSHAKEELPLTKRNVRGRGQKTVKSESVETTAVNDDEAKHKRMGRKREMVQNTKDDVSSTSKVCRGKETETTEAAEEKGKDEAKDEAKDESPVKAKRRGRASSTRAKKNTKESPSEEDVKEESENTEFVKKRGAAQKNKKEKKEANIGITVSSVSQDANIATSQTRTPTSNVSRKRQSSVNSSPVAKTPRSSRSYSASPAASGQQQIANQAYKVLFTGVVDEAGETVLIRLGGSMAKGVADMNCLVTDKVRRTVKFLCAVAKGVPIVTTHWLEKCDKAGRFLSPEAFVVKDPDQEHKFNFSLQESLKAASNQPLLQGYEIHVTKSVKPEPPQMKDIISCSGASFLSKMPSSHKRQTLVISCEEDWQLCGPAVSASLPVVTAEFILTGILQQKVDFATYTLSPPATNPQPAGGKGRGRKKT